MAATELVKDVLWRASVLLQDSVPQFSMWPERDMVGWFNDAQMAIHKYLPLATSRIDTMRLQPGTRQTIEAIPAARLLPGNGSAPPAQTLGTQFLEAHRNMGVDGLSPGRVIRLVARKVKDSQSPFWHTTNGPAISEVIYDPVTPRQFWVVPGAPVDTPVWIDIGYTAQPTKIPEPSGTGTLYGKDGASALLIGVNDEHIDDLTDYIVARANMTDVEWANGEKAIAFAGRFVGSLNAKVAAVTGNNPNLTRLPFAPEPVGRAK